MSARTLFAKPLRDRCLVKAEGIARRKGGTLRTKGNAGFRCDRCAVQLAGLWAVVCERPFWTEVYCVECCR